MMISDLKKVLKEGKLFRVMLIMLYRIKCQLGSLPYLVHREGVCALRNLEDVLSLLGH